MEDENISVNIKCPIHPLENIQRVTVELNPAQELYCLECIVSQDDPTELASALKPISDLIETASVFYTQNKSSLKTGEQAPQRYQEIAASQNEKLEKLSQHIQDEKKKMSLMFDTIMQEVVKMISEKKNEYLHELDKQLFNLRYWYIFFDKQLKKTYPSEEDIPFLFPSKEELVQKLGKMTNATQLMAFVRNLKEDVNEQKLGVRATMRPEEKKNGLLEKLVLDLARVEDCKPHYEQRHQISRVKDQIRIHLNETFYKMLELTDPVADVTKLSTFNSKFMKPQDFQILRNWLPESKSFLPRLIYQNNRDGQIKSNFHKFCEGKENTITIIKGKFAGQNRTSLIGGYLDKPWKVSGQYIKSERAFVFSLTNRIKCDVSLSDYAALLKSKGGPTFGAGPDLTVSNEKVQINYSHTYKGIEKLFDPKNPIGGQSLMIEDIEVYTLN